MSQGNSVYKNVNVQETPNDDIPTDKCKKYPKCDGYLFEDCTTGDLVCGQCGLVAGEGLICEQVEWRSFSDETFAEKQEKSRVSRAENPFFDDNLGTTISMEDINGNRATSFGLNIEKQHKRRSADNALAAAFRNIDEAGDRISLPGSVLRYAKYVYNEFYRKAGLKGNILFLDTKIGACMYVACVKENCARSVGKICAITGENKLDTKKAILKICKKLKIQLNVNHIE